MWLPGPCKIKVESDSAALYLFKRGVFCLHDVKGAAPVTLECCSCCCSLHRYAYCLACTVEHDKSALHACRRRDSLHELLDLLLQRIDKAQLVQKAGQKTRVSRLVPKPLTDFLQTTKNQHWDCCAPMLLTFFIPLFALTRSKQDQLNSVYTARPGHLSISSQFNVHKLEI